MVSAPLSSYDSLRPAVRKLLDDEAYKTALSLLSDVLKSLPPCGAVMDDLSTCYWCLGDPETAIKLSQLAADENPTNAGAWGKLGAMALTAGDRDLAERAYGRTLKIAPRDAKALAALSQMRPFPRNSARARTLRTMAKSPREPKLERAIAYNALGLIDEAEGRFAAAFYNFGRSKAFMPGQYDPAAGERYAEAQETRFQPAPISNPRDEPRFIFVVGMPRSGTTLVESILTRHPDVGTIGESRALKNLKQSWRTRTQAADWAAINALEGDEAAELGRRFIEKARQSHVHDLPPVMVDKTPLNIFDVGFVSRILPGSRFVFMSRHPLDTGLSNFATQYSAAHKFSKTPEHIGHMTRTVFRCARDYRDKIGPTFRWQSYAALVTAPEVEIPAMVDAMGLTWDLRCLSPEDREGIVSTASTLQVREGINTGGLDKWKNYADQLAPMVDALGGWQWIEDWAAEDAACAVATLKSA